MTHDEFLLGCSVSSFPTHIQMVLEVKISPRGRTALMEEGLDTEDSTLTTLGQM